MSTAQVAFTLGGFVLLYLVLGVLDGWLMIRAARRDLDEVPDEWGLDDEDEDDPRHDHQPTKIPALSY